jgi:hypothetical protein
MKKKTLKLSFETLRRLDLDTASGGAHHPHVYSQGGSCGIACTIGPNKPMHSLNPSCGIVCTIGPVKPKPPMHSLNPSCGIVCF